MATLNIHPSSTIKDELEQDLRRYYTRYYRDTLGLPHWQSFVESRLTESSVPRMRFELLERWFNRPISPQDKVLVVGAGTGAEMEAFLDIGCDVVGVEPDPEAVEIGRKKCGMRGQPADCVQQGVGEALAFDDDSFDIVWCYMVLEHVQDVGQSISEMVRVCKPEGHLCICAPDYRHIYEPHYKVLLPMFLPRWMVAIILWFRGRPARFLWTLQLVNSRTVGNLLQDQPVIAFQSVWSWPRSWTESPTCLSRMTKWIARWFGIQRSQMWVVRKLTEPFK